MAQEELKIFKEEHRKLASLEPLMSLVKTDLAHVNDIILERLQSPVTLIPEIAGYLIKSGGKRLRPVLTLACAQLFGYQGEKAISLAASVEFIHTATLLHDDVVDESGLRRGQASANQLWGNQSSVLVGDFLFSRAFELMVEQESLPALKVLSKVSATIAQGEVLQLLHINDLAMTTEKYLEIVHAKTATLFEAAARIGAIIAQRTVEEEKNLQEFGHSLGMAFQLVDDVLDYTADEKTLGKAVGDDFREGKITLPVIHSYQESDVAEKKFWHRVMVTLTQEEGDFKQAHALLEKHQAFEKTLCLAQQYLQKAKQALYTFPSSLIREALLETCTFVVQRKN
ncbi:MAG: polyprenyl synthetase family protein [Candidatus Paracaedimonas acanthamoebae]|uniref:Octaprenyl diphosphate synthase n=1 Tax=Candidatus Paracaedimonas acanthamoebae TaxID=244581 RepID=A0A8J7PV64_9PROT|nr:polyprenyl synthetase family protein [Candidatus Paracaedimonas acanthamoebae]